MNGGLNELALFAGLGGGILGGKLLGWNTVCAVEINPFCCRRLMQRQNEEYLSPFPIWDDVRSFNGKEWKGFVDVVSGGFPCQAFSTATHGHATAIDFWPDMFRIIGEVQPKFVFAENVSRKAIEKAAKDCQSLGYQTETIGLSAKNLGADHIRRRHWLLAYSNMRDELFSTLNAEASRLPKFYLSIWKTYPNESGMVNGMADRMDRFRAIGNGQVPIVVATAFSILIQRFVNQVDKSINIFDNFFIENSISD
jgi:DNA (cytosine-5)-methyltransferase 1